MAPPMSALPERGVVVASRYRLESVIGEGGMAVVWSAVHTETDRRVALKLVKAEFVRDDTIRDLFVREARIAARIGKSEHIVDVLDAGVDDALKVPFIAMELLEGQGLDARIRAGAVPAELAADLLDQLGEALEQAHKAGVFHRDLKPQNLFLTQDRKGKPQLKVLDFGIAKLSESTQQSATHVGTPAYGAPEQLGESWRNIAKQRGKTIAGQVSAGTDVWALGLVAYEMLTGASPGSFWGATTLAELPVKIVLEPLPSASTRAAPQLLPPHFDSWLARCLDLDAQNRWPSARAAVDALLPALRVRPRAPSIPAVAPVVTSQIPRVAPIPTPPPAPSPIAHAPPPHAPPPGTSPPRTPWGPPATGYAMPHTQHPQGGVAGPIDPRLLTWITRWRTDLRSPGDARVFHGWPGTYLPRIEHVSREARVSLHGATVTLAEVLVSDAIRKAVGEERMLVALVQAPRLGYRAAVRSKRSSGGVVDGVSRGLKALDALLVSAPPAGILGDPHFEQMFEVWAPNPHEAHAAIPVSLRQVLVTGCFHGILERFPGAMLITAFGAPRFDPIELDRLLDTCGRVLAAIP